MALRFIESVPKRASFVVEPTGVDVEDASIVPSGERDVGQLINCGAVRTGWTSRLRASGPAGKREIVSGFIGTLGVVIADKNRPPQTQHNQQPQALVKNVGRYITRWGGVKLNLC